VMGLLARALGFTEPWLHQSPDEVIAEVLRATAAHNPALDGITLERLRANGAVPLAIAPAVPFADGKYPTPSGKVELYSQALAGLGADPLPGDFDQRGDDGGIAADDNRWDPARTLHLLTGAAHHFVTSSLASQPGLLHNAGTPFIEIHPADAAARGIRPGDLVRVENGRGWCRLRAVVTEAVRPGVVVSPKGRWAKLSGGRGVNWTTSDALADLAGQSTFHSNRVWVRREEPEVV
jgi:anaerobic selenocysteine-containing dehydrogenase